MGESEGGESGGEGEREEGRGICWPKLCITCLVMSHLALSSIIMGY